MSQQGVLVKSRPVCGISPARKDAVSRVAHTVTASPPVHVVKSVLGSISSMSWEGRGDVIALADGLPCGLEVRLLLMDRVTKRIRVSTH